MLKIKCTYEAWWKHSQYLHSYVLVGKGWATKIGILPLEGRSETTSHLVNSSHFGSQRLKFFQPGTNRHCYQLSLPR